jgi:hypothetical protein
MPKKEFEEKEQAEICEYAIAYDQSRQFKALKSFFLQIRNGPLTAVKAGSLLRLSDRLGNELFFTNKVVPVEIGEIFEVIRPFRMEQAGRWVNLERDDVVKLEEEEAILFLREGKVKEKRGGANET